MIPQAYCYDPHTFRFTEKVSCEPSPLEPGKYYPPANSTLKTPPELIPEGHVVVFSQSERDWLIRELPPEATAEEKQQTLEELRPLRVEEAKRICIGTLNATGWVWHPDAPLTESEMAAWKAYRMEISTIFTSLKTTPAIVDDLVWPTPPPL